MRLAMIVEYDGTDYSGFQFQKNAPSVQQQIEKAIRSITSEVIRVKPAGRTDAGVHARGQVVSFDTGSHHPPDVLRRALNARLPEGHRGQGPLPGRTGLRSTAARDQQGVSVLPAGIGGPGAVGPSPNTPCQRSAGLGHDAAGGRSYGRRPRLRQLRRSDGQAPERARYAGSTASTLKPRVAVSGSTSREAPSCLTRCGGWSEPSWTLDVAD